MEEREIIRAYATEEGLALYYGDGTSSLIFWDEMY